MVLTRAYPMTVIRPSPVSYGFRARERCVSKLLYQSYRDNIFVSRRRLGWVYPCGTFENFCAMETQTINSRVAVQSRRGKGPASCQGSPRYVPPRVGGVGSGDRACLLVGVLLPRTRRAITRPTRPILTQSRQSLRGEAAKAQAYNPSTFSRLLRFTLP